jgi:hypothetical protein
VKRTAPPHARAGLRGGARWGGVTSPQFLIAAFAFIAALAAYVTSAPTPRPPPPLLDFVLTPPARDVREVRYVVVDARGLERPGYADAAPPLDRPPAAALLTASLAALHADLAAAGIWPAGVAAPTAHVIERDRRPLALIDVPPASLGPPIEVAHELTALRSLTATARAAVPTADVRITVGGRESATLWGTVALPAP